MITRNVYDLLSMKSPFNSISKSDIGVDGHPFEIDGVTYIHLIMKNKNKEKLVLEYKPVILPLKLVCVFLTLNQKKSLRSAFVNESNHTLEYHTENDRTVSVKLYRVRKLENWLC